VLRTPLPWFNNLGSLKRTAYIHYIEISSLSHKFWLKEKFFKIFNSKFAVIVKQIFKYFYEKKSNILFQLFISQLDLQPIQVLQFDKLPNDQFIFIDLFSRSQKSRFTIDLLNQAITADKNDLLNSLDCDESLSNRWIEQICMFNEAPKCELCERIFFSLAIGFGPNFHPTDLIRSFPFDREFIELDKTWKARPSSTSTFYYENSITFMWNFIWLLITSKYVVEIFN
jgi:hypothetical protein